MLNMTVPRLLLLSFFILSLISCEKPVKSESSIESSKHHRAIIYFDPDEEIQIDYEGTGYRQSSMRSGEEVEFKAIHFNPSTDEDIQNEKWVDTSFKGTVTLSGEENENVRIVLKVDNKVPFEIQSMGIRPKAAKESDEAITYKFSPGQHDLIIEGKVTDYFEKE